LVGYRSDSGHKLVDEEEAQRLEGTFFDELLTSDGEQLRTERELVRLLAWAHGERPNETKARVQRLVADDAFLRGLLVAALAETIGQTTGEAAVRRTYELNWRLLVEWIPQERLAERVRRLDSRGEGEPSDARTRLALEQAREYADGRRKTGSESGAAASGLPNGPV
jgi:hypothetical protein